MAQSVVINQSGLTSLRNPSIRLTPVTVDRGRQIVRDAITVNIHDLLGYSQQQGFTRVYLVGGRSFDVREDTANVDRLVRSAATAQFPGE